MKAGYILELFILLLILLVVTFLWRAK